MSGKDEEMKNSMEHRTILKAILIKNRKLTLDEQGESIDELLEIIRTEVLRINYKRRIEGVDNYKLKEVK